MKVHAVASSIQEDAEFGKPADLAPRGPRGKATEASKTSGDLRSGSPKETSESLRKTEASRDLRKRHRGSPRNADPRDPTPKRGGGHEGPSLLRPQEKGPAGAPGKPPPDPPNQHPRMMRSQSSTVPCDAGVMVGGGKGPTPGARSCSARPPQGRVWVEVRAVQEPVLKESDEGARQVV